MESTNSMRSRLTAFLTFTVLTGASSGQTDAVLRGAGATFPAPIYQKWIESFQAAAPGMRVLYEAVGSEEGIERLRRGEVDFAASDILPDKTVEDQLGIQTLPSV